MVKSKHLLILLVLTAFGLGLFYFLREDDEKRVKKQFRQLSEWISKEPGESLFTIDKKMKGVGSVLDDQCEILIPAHSMSGSYARDEITGHLIRARIYFAQLHLRFYDMEIVFTRENEVKVHLTARLTGKSNSGDDISEAHEFNILLNRIDKKWVIKQAEVVEVLKK